MFGQGNARKRETTDRDIVGDLVQHAVEHHAKCSRRSRLLLRDLAFLCIDSEDADFADDAGLVAMRTSEEMIWIRQPGISQVRGK